LAFQTLYNEGTCEAFKASNPTCFGEGHGVDSGRCPDAAVFQLVMDRNRDLDRTYLVNDFPGVARNLYQNGSVFVDSVVETHIADLYQNWSASEIRVNRVPRNVLGRNVDSNSSKWVLHEVGSWIEDGDVARYTRWSYTGNPFGWQIVTDVDLRETDNKIEQSGYADIIRGRYAVYNTLYNAGNLSGLVAEMYTSDAVLALTAGSFVDSDSLERVLNLFYDADPHRNFSVSVAVGQDGGNVIHDLGTISMGSQRYYARWERCGDDWKIAVHAHDGYHHHRPHDSNSNSDMVV
jgi:hypothetical protein